MSPSAGNPVLERTYLFFYIIRFNFHFFFIKINKNLVSVLVLAGIPNLHIFRGYFDQYLRILMAVGVVTVPEELFIALLKTSSRFIYDKPLVFGDSLHLDSAPAQGYLGILKKLFCFSEIFVCFKINLVVIKKTSSRRADGT